MKRTGARVSGSSPPRILQTTAPTTTNPESWELWKAWRHFLHLGGGCCWNLMGGGQGRCVAHEAQISNHPPQRIPRPNAHSASLEEASSSSWGPQHPGVLDKFEDWGPGDSGWNPDPSGRSLKAPEAVSTCKPWGCEHSLQRGTQLWLHRVDLSSPPCPRHLRTPVPQQQVQRLSPCVGQTAVDLYSQRNVIFIFLLGKPTLAIMLRSQCMDRGS